MNSLIQDFQSLESGWTNLVTMMQHWRNSEVNVQEFVRQFMGPPPEQGRKLTEHTNTLNDIFRRIESERARLGQSGITSTTSRLNAWELFNGVQGYYQHNAGMHGNPTPTERAIRGFSHAKTAAAEKILVSMMA